MLADLFCKLESRNLQVAVVRLPRSVRKALEAGCIADGKLWGATVRLSKSSSVIEIEGDDGHPKIRAKRATTLTAKRP